MTKNQFLAELERHLNKLPKQELEDILRDYEEYFQNALSDGKTEQEIAKSLGSPKQLAKELLATHYIEEVEKSDSALNIARAIWAAVGLGFLNIIFILGPFIGIVATVASLWFSAFIFIITPLFVLIKAIFFTESFVWLDLFIAITLSGIGILFIIGLYYATALLKKWTIQYLKFNVAIVKGDKNIG